MNEYELRITENKRKLHKLNAAYQINAMSMRMEKKKAMQDDDTRFHEQLDELNKTRLELKATAWARLGRETQMIIEDKITRNREEIATLRKKHKETLLGLIELYERKRLDAYDQYQRTKGELYDERHKIDEEYGLVCKRKAELA